MLKNYEVIARPLPTEKVPNPPAIRVQVFASDEVCAKSQFWGVARKQARLKKSHGEILAVKQVFEPEPTRVKNYGVWLTFRSVRGVHNIYKEFRDVTTEGAILKLYQEMAGSHNVQPKAISIIKIAEIKAEDVKHRTIEQFAEEHIKFPIVKKQIRAADPTRKSIFRRKRPTICGF